MSKEEFDKKILVYELYNELHRLQKWVGILLILLFATLMAHHGISGLLQIGPTAT